MANPQRYCPFVATITRRLHGPQFGLDHDTAPEPRGKSSSLHIGTRTPAAEGDETAALRAIVEGTARGTGEVFFHSLVRHLATAIGVDYAFVAEFAGKRTRVRTVAYWGKGQIARTSSSTWPGPPARMLCVGGYAIIPTPSRRDSRTMTRWSLWGSRAI